MTSEGVPADLSRLRLAAVDVGVLVESGVLWTAAPVGGVPLAWAVLSTEPEFTSAWVMSYVAVQVVDSPGASVVVGHDTGAAFGSVTLTPVTVTAPVLVTTNA